MKFKCEICRKNLLSPVSLECGHICCWRCICKHLETSSVCPKCEKIINREKIVPIFGCGKDDPDLENLPPMPEHHSQGQNTTNAPHNGQNFPPNDQEIPLNDQEIPTNDRAWPPPNHGPQFRGPFMNNFQQFQFGNIQNGVEVTYGFNPLFGFHYARHVFIPNQQQNQQQNATQELPNQRQRRMIKNIFVFIIFVFFMLNSFTFTIF